MKLMMIKLPLDKDQHLFSSGYCQEAISTYEEWYPISGFHIPWVGYFIIKDQQVVGTCGFTGKPTDGRVEIGYWTFKEYEGRGIASFACSELVSMALHEEPTLQITAKTAPGNDASTRILRKNGFRLSGIVTDYQTGNAWFWKLESPSHPADRKVTAESLSKISMTDQLS
jgi:[ribosomal protein S5]-alanine N-acetyltransferase